ncbi:NAD-dependent epimerase/dehydratase family protein [Plantibacter sp. PA-3-X8]|uniref:NAD-dependent epimerase/dehydratase family protein n=1 Tax=Plantibacter sp. PA-3-X8 TaxID=2480625 RepID=UPI000F5DF9EF|nr:NAD-dependent epimerase/dehydratase family protein [Plantibacter sp. PA-3-X8]AZH83014.1 NAD-dependent epimerase/dehydratase family protein [Plantibacter sp. PA-3-X8]
MTTKRILFIGGSGIISSASVARAVSLGHDVTVLNRGLSHVRPLPEEVELLRADVRDTDAVTETLGSREFDVVAQFTAFTPPQVQADIDRFAGRIGQYVFVSSASAYQKPPQRLPVVESTPLRNPFSQYARDKISCEDVLVHAYREQGFPATIVRPSHTYDRTLIPTMGRRTDLDRMRAGKPVVVHGDGTTRWTITHTEDFAVGFVGLLGRRDVLGEAFHITGDHAPSWNDITRWIAEAAGVEADIVHVPSDVIAEVHPPLGPTLLGDKAFPMVFDNTRIRSLVPEFRPTIPFWDGAAEMVAFHDANPHWQPAEPELDAAFDRMVAAVGH